MSSLINENTRIKVSSVLNRDSTNFGKQNLVDGQVETCWNSEQGLPQHILLDFSSPASVQAIVFQFQGGFVGKKCVVVGSIVESPNDYNVPVDTLYPEDVNSIQTFSFEPTQPLKRIKIIFEESTDFYGRITLYKLDILGH
ncbi:galactose-binding domain-like protein [Cokeromyces recurvatus]|uniref:galactose-binding domain-like protein n=1 Tax=Cokeromyces recurvatus TaxID=90255 RepID=UPI00222118F2|nr:galactose-binding domain-like protein [Cokeromyces recurvatus]KAI7899478.1 galactose-binding domain-like protein [Cokeromyces recurvatus]